MVTFLLLPLNIFLGLDGCMDVFTLLKQCCATEFEGPSFSSPSAMGVEYCCNPCLYTRTHLYREIYAKTSLAGGKKGKSTNFKSEEYGCYRDHFKK